VWAEVICVMEEKHQRHLCAQFGALLAGKPLHVLDIPDDYRFMDAELVELVRVSVAAALIATPSLTNQVHLKE
jgi:predicted protein tyrosine phosphatase